MSSNSRSATYTYGVIVEHLRDGQLDYELDKCDELRDPPVPVTAWLLLDSAAHDGLLYGWAADPNGGNDGWRGLVRLIREFSPHALRGPARPRPPRSRGHPALIAGACGPP